MGDGCNMEGISAEAAGLAGHWGLGKLIALYDDNRISIDGHTEISFTEDVCARYEAQGWHVQHVKDGNHDLDGLRAAIQKAKVRGAGLRRGGLRRGGLRALPSSLLPLLTLRPCPAHRTPCHPQDVTDKPSLIKVSTLIGYGSPNKADTHDVHGAPLGAAETAATREALKWPYGEFEVRAACGGRGGGGTGHGWAMPLHTLVHPRQALAPLQPLLLLPSPTTPPHLPHRSPRRPTPSLPSLLSAAPPRTRRGRRCAPPTPPSTPRSTPSLSLSPTASCPPTGPPSCPSSPPRVG